MEHKVYCSKEHNGCGKEIDFDNEYPAHFSKEDYWLCRKCYEENWEEDDSPE